MLTLSPSATPYVSWQLMNPLEGFFGATPDSFRGATEEMRQHTGT